MSVLAPLYLLGLIAVSLPLAFHLIRRTPRGEMTFSSLMFLRPSPPRLAKRSRLDNLLLLLLRALALALLAGAFSRPFFRQAAIASVDDLPRRRVAVLLDASASMRRAGLWQQATAAANDTFAELRPQDEFAVYCFDETLRPVASFQDLAEIETSRRRLAAAELIRTLQPTWAGTHLGRCLGEVLEAMRETQHAADDDQDAPQRIVLISDMQAGGRLDELAETEWPEDATLELITLTPPAPTNAGLELLADRPPAQTVEQARDARVRVRVTNAADSVADTFRLQWRSPDGETLGGPTDVFAPPGERRVARVALPPRDLSEAQLVLEGDAHEFDNTVYFLSPAPQQVRVVYLGGDDPGDAQGMAYYLKQAVESNASRTVDFQQIQPGTAPLIDDDEPHLIVVAAPPSSSQMQTLRNYLEQGGTALYVATGRHDSGPLATLLDAPNLDVSDVEPTDYAMLAEIEFNHPLFSAMAGPQFNNFTQILFWKYRRIDETALDDVNVLARFDSGDPAVLEKRLGTGKLTVLSAGWNPGDSQLARSWKFLLMLSSLIESDQRDTAFAAAYQVNRAVPLPNGITLPADARVVKPDGAEMTLANDAATIDGVDQPGIYRVATQQGMVQFAAQLDPAESDTARLPQEAFEQLGAKTTGAFDADEQLAKMRQLRDVELEGRQKVWKWLIAAAVAVLIIETALAGWFSRPAESAPAHA